MNILPWVARRGLWYNTAAVNMPGTDTERPNWRKLRVAVQTLFALGAAQAILEEVRRKRETPSRTGRGKASG
jgi:hypothetical protein